MKKKQRPHLPQVAGLPAQADALAQSGQQPFEAFSFGDPTPVLDSGEILDSLECWLNGRWYEPPISLPGLAKSFNSSVHHSSAIYFKANILTSTFVPNKRLSHAAFKRFALDFLTFGNAYLEKRNSGVSIKIFRLA